MVPAIIYVYCAACPRNDTAWTGDEEEVEQETKIRDGRGYALENVDMQDADEQQGWRHQAGQR